MVAIRHEYGHVNALALVSVEREHQRTDLGYYEAHDDQLTNGELGRAAIGYADKVISETEGVDIDWPPYNFPKGWTVGEEPDDIHYLVKAAALLCAEIDRRLRLLDKDAQ